MKEPHALLGIHERVVTFAIQTAIAQGLALLHKLLESREKSLSEHAMQFPEHLRNAYERTGLLLAASGIRHRHAYVQLRKAFEIADNAPNDVTGIRNLAEKSLRTYRDQWQQVLGSIVYENTLSDLA